MLKTIMNFVHFLIKTIKVPTSLLTNSSTNIDHILASNYESHPMGSYSYWFFLSSAFFFLHLQVRFFFFSFFYTFNKNKRVLVFDLRLILIQERASKDKLSSIYNTDQLQKKTSLKHILFKK